MEGTDSELVDNYKVGAVHHGIPIKMHVYHLCAMFPGESVGLKNAVLNRATNVCMEKFEGNVVPMVIHKRQRLLPTESGLSYSNFNVTTMKGNV